MTVEIWQEFDSYPAWLKAHMKLWLRTGLTPENVQLADQAYEFFAPIPANEPQPPKQPLAMYPYGYNEYEQRIVREIARRRARDEHWAAIARALNKVELVNRYGRRWCWSQVKCSYESASKRRNPIFPPTDEER